MSDPVPAVDSIRNNRPVSTVPVDEASSLKQYTFFRRCAIATLILSCGVALTLNLADPDLWGHVKYGQELLGSGKLPVTSTHTYTAQGYPWINHENFAEIVMAVLYEQFGTRGLLIFKCGLGLAILGLMVAIARIHQVGQLAAWAVMLLVATNLTAFFPVRPQLLSFAWFAVVLYLLERGFSHWRDDMQVEIRWLWMIPLIFVAWVNSHGAFVAGLCVVGAYLGGRGLELLLRRGKQAQATILKFAAVGLACLAATLVNPYGYRLPLWLAESLGSPRPEITEWASPKPGDPVFIPFLLLLATAIVVMFGNRRRRDWTQIVILALVATQAGMHLRHIAFFALLCGFWLPRNLNQFIERIRKSQSQDLPHIVLGPWQRRLAIATVAVVVVAQTSVLAMRLNDLPVYRNRYPVDAINFLADQDVSGRLVVSFNWAQYAIAALAPDVKVHFDGRFRTCYPQTIVDEHFDFILGPHKGLRFRAADSGPIDGSRALRREPPDLLLLDRSYEHAREVLAEVQDSQSPPFVLLYQDAIAQVWGRADRFDDPASPAYISKQARIISDREPQGWISWPALPSNSTQLFSIESQRTSPSA